MVTKKKKNPVSIEFLIEMLASVQSALKSIEKESSEKTEALGELSENIIIIGEMLKNLHGQKAHDSDKIASIENQIRLLQSEIKSDDIKEIKYAIQNLSSNLLELKAIETTKKELGTTENKKWKILSFLQDLVNGFGNLKSILLIVLVIFILIVSVFFDPNAFDIFIDIVKKLVA